MDIMFSPYGVGGIPKDALEEIERRTEELLKANSFQEMIERQKKCKSERLEETQLLAIPYSATTPGEQPSLSPQTERTYFLSQQQRDLMLKAMKRSITLPSLSLAIPQQPDNPNKRSQPSQWEMEDDEDADSLTPTNTEPAPKQVKFLEDDAMSDQSSICHSPSWETYGQKKKEKKLEAERRKKEKVLAEKEAKAAKKQNTSRLSKLPPSNLVTAERSMSDPSLISQHLQKSQLTQRSQDTGRAASTDNLQQIQPNAHSRMELRRTASEGPDLLYQSMSHPPVSKPDGKLPRDACPPSASRTPMLRHMSPSGHSRSQENLSTYLRMDPNHKDDYVQYQRAQSCEKAMASLADEELFENSSRHSPRSSSRSRLSSRRSSLTQEAKAAALKLVGIRATQTSRNDHLACNRSSTHGDYFGFPDHQPTSVGLDPMTSVSDRPHTSHSSLSLGGQSSTDSTSSSQSKKNRSLKEAARSALHLSKGTQSSTNSPKSPTSMPPYLALRSRMQSRSSASPESITSHHAPEVNQAAEVRAAVPASAISTQDTGPDSQAGSRVSEGSSSSSGYGDGSSLPSSTTTPDTSRPQSARDVPLDEAELLRGDLKPSDSQDDEQTLRQSMDSSKSSTPRLEDSELHGSPQIGDGDRWSRTSLSIDIDCDAQSFKTSVSNLDDTNEGTPDDSSESHFKTQQQQSYGDKQAKELQTAESWSDAQQYIGESSHGIDNNPPSFTTPVISIPPRSQRRNTVSSTKTSPIEPLQRFAKDATEPPVRYEQVENRSGRPSKPEQANKKQKRQSKLRDLNAGELVGSRETADFSGTTSPDSHHSRSSTESSSAGSARLSAGPASPAERSTFSSEYQVRTNPYFEELPVERQAISPTSSLPNSRPQSSSRPSSQPRTQSAPTLPAAAPGAPSTSTPSPAPSTSHRSSKLAPVSILKQSKSQPLDIASGPPSPGRPPVLSALPKHMQLQAGISVRPPTTSPEARPAPIAKMFVECCSCKFYHDMPSKIYECMTKPDAVVEDRALGISGAITTMVKCPWCHHNMSTSCCAGYAAVVYLKEKLH